MTWLLMASPKFTTTKNVHSNEVESLVYAFVVHRRRDSLNSGERKPELTILVVSSSSLFVWELAVCKPTTCTLYWIVYMHKRARAQNKVASVKAGQQGRPNVKTA